MPDWYNPLEVDGQIIRRVRERLRITQVELAERLGITRRTLIRWENGVAKFDRYAYDHNKKYPELVKQAKLAGVKLPPCDRESTW